jgi:tetratricopeptide (TPR) repeat protein
VEAQRGIKYFKRSIQIDSSFALAYAAMGNLYSMFAYFDSENNLTYVDSANEVVGRALRIDPDLPEALNVKGYLFRTFEWKWEEARALFVKASKLDPNNSIILRNYSLLLLALNELDTAIRTAVI